MPGQVTVTGVIGPGNVLTSTVLPNVSEFKVNTDKEILTVVTSDRIVEISIAAATTFTVAITAPNIFTVVVS